LFQTFAHKCRWNVGLGRKMGDAVTCALGMKQKFVFNIILLVILNLLVKPVYILAVEAEVQNKVGAESYGTYFALLNLSFLMNILLDWGITNWNTRHIAQNSSVLQKHFSKLFTSRFILILVFIPAIFIAAIALHYRGEQLWLLSIIALSQVFASLLLFLRSNLAGLHLFKEDSMVSILDRSFMILALGYLLWGRSNDAGFDIFWLAYGLLFSYIAACSVAFWILWKHIRPVKWMLDWPFTLSILRQSTPFALLIAVSMLGARTDAILLDRLAGADEAGIYAMGFRFFESLSMIAYLFGGLLLPMFARALSEREDITGLVDMGCKFLFAGCFAAAIWCFVDAKAILSLFYMNHLDQAGETFKWQMLAAVCFSMQYVFGTLLTADGQLRPLIRIALVGVVYNVALNLWYIPQFGSVGAAMACLLTQALILSMQVYVVYLRYRIQGMSNLFWRMLAYAVVLIAGAYFYENQTIFRLGTALDAGIFGIFAVAVAVLTGLLDWRAGQRMLRAKF
jgi:O-antigen/teichoic acid export membrane protein